MKAFAYTPYYTHKVAPKTELEEWQNTFSQALLAQCEKEPDEVILWHFGVRLSGHGHYTTTVEIEFNANGKEGKTTLRHTWTDSVLYDNYTSQEYSEVAFSQEIIMDCIKANQERFAQVIKEFFWEQEKAEND
jgi:hypothetical protein